jgi:hypothetical protein
MKGIIIIVCRTLQGYSHTPISDRVYKYKTLFLIMQKT